MAVSRLFCFVAASKTRNPNGRSLRDTSGTSWSMLAVVLTVDEQTIARLWRQQALRSETTNESLPPSLARCITSVARLSGRAFDSRRCRPSSGRRHRRTRRVPRRPPPRRRSFSLARRRRCSLAPRSPSLCALSILARVLILAFTVRPC